MAAEVLDIVRIAAARIRAAEAVALSSQETASAALQLVADLREELRMEREYQRLFEDELVEKFQQAFGRR